MTRVESHWIAGRHVNWRTGEPDQRPVPIEGHHSHCSAFVAAVATKLGVDILRPPEHSQILLADAQCRWLESEGPQSGWDSLATPLEAQQLANRGRLVVACYVNPDPRLPGHIAIVRPEALSRRRIESDGPQVTQAVHEAAKNGDRSENGDYIYGKRRLREIDRRVAYLDKRLAQLQVVRDKPANLHKVYFGAWVSIEDENGKTTTYRIVGPDEFDLKRNLLSMDSPLARHMLGKQRDDVFYLEQDGKPMEYAITAIAYR